MNASRLQADGTFARHRGSGLWRLPAVLVSRVDIALVLVFVVAVLFYGWTASTSENVRPGDQTDVYNQMTDSLLAGRASYPVQPPAGLLRLPDPYDPVSNERYRSSPLTGAPNGLHDLSLYKGKLYEYWGMAPALTLFLPWRALPVGELSQGTAVWLFVTLALAWCLLLLRLLVRRAFPHARPWAVVLAAIAVAFGTASPFLLRRPAVYEVAIAASACFLMAGLYLLAAAVRGETARPGQIAGASLCFGLAFNSRPPLVVAGVVLLGLALTGHRLYPSLRPRRRRLAAVLLGPFSICVLLTLTWNVVRFDSPLEFGVKYQLANLNTSNVGVGHPSYVLPGVWSYVFAPPRVGPGFPYVRLSPPSEYPGSLPRGYWTIEPVGGLLPTAPIVLFALAVPFWWRRSRPGDRGSVAVVAGLVGLGALIMLADAFAMWMTSQRYELDFDLPLSLGGLLTWVALMRRTGDPWRTRLTRTLGVVAIAWTVFCSVTVSFTGYENRLQLYHPATYRALQDLNAL